MKNRTRVIMTLIVLGSWQLSGCNPASLVTIPPVVISLTDNNVADFDVAAGVPKSRAIGGISGVDARGFTLSGNIELAGSSITVTPSDSSDNKLAVVQQVVDDCLAACNDAQVDAAVCDDVCSNGQLQITVWAAESGNTSVCDGGEDTDEYGPYVVTLDLADNGRVVSVNPSTVSLTTRTETWLTTTGTTFCVQVISPISGTVIIDSLTVNLSL